MEVMFDTTVSVMSLAFKTKASAMAAMIMIMMMIFLLYFLVIDVKEERGKKEREVQCKFSLFIRKNLVMEQKQTKRK